MGSTCRTCGGVTSGDVDLPAPDQLPAIGRSPAAVARLGPTIGTSEQAGYHPAIVVSIDLVNERSWIVMIVPCTSRMDRLKGPFRVAIQPPDGGLDRDTVAMVDQLRAVDRIRFRSRRGRLSDAVMEEIETAMGVLVGLLEL